MTFLHLDSHECRLFIIVATVVRLNQYCLETTLFIQFLTATGVNKLCFILFYSFIMLAPMTV